MIIIGLVLLLLGYLLGIHLLWVLGAVLLVVGVIFLVLSQIGRPVGGRNWY